MKRFFFAAFLFAGLPIRAWMAEGTFTGTMSPADFDAAGLRKLNADQLARLNALVEAYRSGMTSSVVPAAATPPVARPLDASPGAALAAKPKTEAPAGARPGLIAQARNLLKSSARDEPPPLATSVVGTFQGWKPRQIFTLASGERVQIANNDSYYTPAIENPKVELSRANLAGYWLRFPDLNVQVRVNLLPAP